MAKSERLVNATRVVVENLEAISMTLDRCVDEGMIDLGSKYHNELCDLIDQSRISKTWDDLEEVISKGKTLETDIDVWLSMHGRTSISLPWPSQDEPLDDDLT